MRIMKIMWHTGHNVNGAYDIAYDKSYSKSLKVAVIIHILSRQVQDITYNNIQNKAGVGLSIKTDGADQ